jgi:hypothetical protein
MLNCAAAGSALIVAGEVRHHTASEAIAHQVAGVAVVAAVIVDNDDVPLDSFLA